jgi:hypothetical protein
MAQEEVVRSEDRIIHFREGRNARVEYLLPSGGNLIDDMEEHRSVRTEIRTAFDWESTTASGAEINESSARERLQKGESSYVIRYQDIYNEEGFVVETRLRLVEQYGAAGKVRVEEYDKVVPTPEHLRGNTIEKQ